MEERIHYIYRHLREDTGVPFYIGKGSRREEYKSDRKIYARAYHTYNRSKFWKNIAKKAGYIVEIMLDDLTEREAFDKEIEFIALYKKTSEGGILCNLTEGGEGSPGTEFSEELKKDIAVRCHKRRSGRKLTPEWKEKIRLSMIEARKRKSWSSASTEETRAREQAKKERKKKLQTLAENHVLPKPKGEKYTTFNYPTAREVVCLQTGFVFDSAGQAAKSMFETNEKRIVDKIYRICIGRIKEPCNGFTFAFA